MARDTLQIVGFSRSIQAGETFVVETSGERFRNPPSAKTISTYQASSFKQDGSTVGHQSMNISYRVSTPATISADNVSIRAATGEINQE